MMMLTPILMIIQLIEHVLFFMVRIYDRFVYTPIQVISTPFVKLVPRTIGGVTVFNANIVTYSRTLLIVPIGIFLKYGRPVNAFWCVLLHDYLDHLDGIVAKAHKVMGYQDDPLLGCFMDAFCDKVVNVFAFWTILMLTPFDSMSIIQMGVYISVVSIIIAYEIALGIVRVQDYFYSAYANTSESRNLAASMEGKLKEKLESMGIMFLCLCQQSKNPWDHWGATAGVVCLVLTMRMAHASLAHKMEGRVSKSS